MKKFLFCSVIATTLASALSSCTNDVAFDEFSYPKTEVAISVELPIENKDIHKLLDSVSVHVQDELFPISSWFGNVALNGKPKKAQVRKTQSTPFSASPDWSGYLSKKASSPTIQVYSSQKQHHFDAEKETAWIIKTEPTVALLALPNATNIEISTKFGKAQSSHFFKENDQTYIYIYCDYELGSDKYATFRPIEVNISIDEKPYTISCERGKIYDITNNTIKNF